MAARFKLQMNWQLSLLQQNRKSRPPIGLKNLGNTCYLNSVIQCLTYTPPLANFCLNRLHSSLCVTVSQAKRDCPFCLLEKRIVRSLSADLTLDAPSKILNCLKIFAGHFRCGHQEDAHEFLRHVIDACHNTCLRLKKLAGMSGDPVNGNTVFKEIFGGALQSQVKCLTCDSESNKIDEIMDISLDVLHSSSLKEALQKFFQPEILDGSNKYKCDNCKKLVAARKQMSIHRAPNVLVIQLKRFEGILGGKIDKAVTFEEVLVLSSFMCKGSKDLQPEYKLFGTIVHSGYSAESGHYYAYIKDAMGRWYCCNDSYVSLSTLKNVFSEKVYILFFSLSNKRPTSGVKSRDFNCTDKTRVPKESLAQQAGHTKPHAEDSSGKDECIVSKVNRVSSSSEIKSKPLSSSSERNPVIVNGTIDLKKTQSMEINGVVKSLTLTGKGENNMFLSVDRNVKESMPSSMGKKDVGNKNMVDALSREDTEVSVLANGLVQRVNCGLLKLDEYEGIRTTQQVTKGRWPKQKHNGHANGHIDNLQFKRKSPESDSCVLLAEDTHSQAELEELKEYLRKEALSVLRSCGWSDKVRSYMCSRKRTCEREAGSIHFNQLKKQLIADAKSTFISQIPESLKENLIGRIKSFKQDKQSPLDL